jgi:MoaA/NifB/PqqE/SkfB family radical SAM enzyme
LEGVISWNLNTACNYRCSYCTQRHLADRKASAKDLDTFLAFFSALPGDWEVKLSGGEPFRHPNFLDIVSGLISAGRRVSVVTNLSSPVRVLERYCDLVRPLPGVLSASMHVEYTTAEDFCAKVAHVAAVHAGPVVATCVATRQNLPHLASWHALFRDAGLRFRVQPEKQDRDVIAYTDAEMELLSPWIDGGAGVAPNYLGRPCWAGARSAILDHRGDVWRCYPARRHKSEYLGNVLAGTARLRREAQPCLYRYCNCTVPQERGMMPRQEAECRSPVV